MASARVGWVGTNGSSADLLPCNSLATARLRPELESATMRLLVVEDNVADARLIIEALRGCTVPTQVAVTHDGVQALLYLRGEGEYAGVARPDVILLDLNLPKKDGRQVLMEIKSDPILKHIPVIMFTSSEAEFEILQAYRNGASCYLVKPLELAKYFSLVQEVIEFWGTRARLPGTSST